MITRKNTFFLSIFIFLIPFFGVPGSWRTFFILTSAVLLFMMSVQVSLPKKVVKPKSRREKSTPVFVESLSVYPKDNTVESSVGTVVNNESEIK